MMYIYILKEKQQESKLTKLGKKKLLVNNVLVLEIDNRGMLLKKNFIIKKMKKLKISKNETEVNLLKKIIYI